MVESPLYSILLVCFLGAAGVFFIILFFVTAPYGRHVKSGWGSMVNSRWGWLIMESPACLLFLAVCIASGRRIGAGAAVLLLVWQSHYVYRAFFYPFTLRKKKNMPLAIVISAFGFNVINAYLQAGWIFSLSPPHRYGTAWLTDIRFGIGILIFYAGLTINRSADRYLRRLSLFRESGYGLPEGGLFAYVSCPNYLGEIIQWAGWAVAVWSFSGLAFALWTLANLLPRARAHHLWYKNSFPEYPKKRKALIPFIY